jgi:thiamine pyrophosphate-dependent acetolactate synthase large subunit-like protein
MCDGTYASIRDRAVEKGLSQRPLHLDRPDWTAVAQALGLSTGRADKLEDVAAFVSRWQPSAGPAFLQLDFAPEPYRMMTRALRA